MTQNDNPYVGPRPFERKKEDLDRFFGRSHETEEIVSLIFGHPLTLIYAQSGAGKTSLFNASIAPNLEQNGFEVLPLTRVGDILLKVDVKEVKNLYIFNALLTMDLETDPLSLTSKSLSEFLKTRNRNKDENGQPCPRAIIFDQFEELFTYIPVDWRKQRKDFFDQITRAIEDDPFLRVVFVIREDYLAELDPYARDLPERLRIRYRLERLGENAALRAVKDPLAHTHRRFAPGVAEELVKQLLTIRTVDNAGEMTEIEGQYVEPVQLQVVCVTLWSGLEPEVIEIQQTHLENFNVSDALSNFYKIILDLTVKETGVEEADLRNWFGKTLITPMGTRSTVFRGEVSTGGIDNKVVDFLVGHHIIRAEIRAGARWYELTHDRLVEPIIADNAKWFTSNLSLFQQQAALWAAQGQPEGMLLRGNELDLAEQEQRKKESESKTIPKIEQDFLAACLRLRARERRERRGNILLRVLAVGMATALIATVYFAYQTIKAQQATLQAQQEMQEAFQANATNTAIIVAAQATIGGLQEENEQTRARETANDLAKKARISLRDLATRKLGRLLAVQAFLINKKAGEGKILPVVYQALFESAGLGNDIPMEGSFLFAAFNPDFTTNALIVDNEMWNVEDVQQYPLVDTGKVVAGTFRSGGEAVIITENTSSLLGNQSPYTVYIRDIKNQNIRQLSLALPESAYVATDISLSDNGNWILLGYGLKPNSDSTPTITTGGIQLWDIQNLSSNPVRLSVQDSTRVLAVALDPVGESFALVDDLRHLYLWSGNKSDTFKFLGIIDALNIDATLDDDFLNGVYLGESGKGLQFSPDGRRLAVLTKQGIQIFDTSNSFRALPRIRLPDYTIVTGYVFSSDGSYLIYATNSYSDCRDFYYNYLFNYEYLSYVDYYAYSDYYNCNPVTSVNRWSLSDPNPKPSPVLENTISEITAMSINISGGLAIGDKAGYVWVKEVAGELDGSIYFNNVHDSQVVNILSGPDNKMVLSTGEKDGTRLWKIAEIEQNAITSVPTYNTTTQVIRNKNQDEDLLVVGGVSTIRNMAAIQIYSTKQDTLISNELRFDSVTSGRLNALALGERWVVAGRTEQGYYSNNVQYYLDIWDRSSATFPEAKPITFTLDSQVSSLKFDQTGMLLAVATEGGDVWLDTLTNLDERAIGDVPTPATPGNEDSSAIPQFLPERNLQNTLKDVQAITFVQNGKYLIAASTQGVHLWNLSDFQEYELQNAIYPIHISGDQKWLATTSLDGSVRLYGLENIFSSPIVIPNNIPVTQYAFSDDSSLLAVAVKTGKVLVYDLSIPRFPILPDYILNGRVSEDTQFEFSPSSAIGRWLVASGGNSVYLWNLENPQDDPIILQGHTGKVIYAGFSQDGKQIITAAADRTIRFWSMDPETLADTACAYAERNLLPKEWKDYIAGTIQETCPKFEYGLITEENVAEFSPTPQATIRPYQTPMPTPTSTPVPLGDIIEYKVKEGDTLLAIAGHFNVDLAMLLQDNIDIITDKNNIYPGQILKIRVVPTPTPTITP